MSLHEKGKYQKRPACNAAGVLLLLVFLIAGTLGGAAFFKYRNSDRGQQDAKLAETVRMETANDSATEKQADGEIKITYLEQSELSVMKEPDLSAFYNDMLSVTKDRELSVKEMETIGYNFFYIWKSCGAVERNEFNQRSYQVFCNIYDQLTDRRIPLEEVCYYWTRIPVPDIQCKYFSSSNFSVPENATWTAFDSLNEEQLRSVADAFFANPIMRVNTHIPRYLIVRDFDDTITDKSWQHFENLSKDVSPNTSLSSEEFTSMFYHSLVGAASDDEDNHKFVNIAGYILENPYYDIKTKYMYFCNYGYNGEKKEYWDATIAFRAVDSLLILAKKADEETRVQLYELLDLLGDDNVADALRNALSENE